MQCRSLLVISSHEIEMAFAFLKEADARATFMTQSFNLKVQFLCFSFFPISHSPPPSPSSYFTQALCLSLLNKMTPNRRGLNEKTMQISRV